MNTPLTDVQNRFVEFVLERERIRLDRAHAAKPREAGTRKTRDAILRDYSFCNVHREHDRVSCWVRKHVHVGGSLTDAVVQYYCARTFNEPSVLERLLPFRDAVTLHASCAVMRDEGKRLLRGAYLVVCHGTHSTGSTVEEYYGDILEQLQRIDMRHFTSLREVAEAAMTVKGVGAFMANQVCADLRYSTFAKRFQDWDSFVLAGPGTLRGLNRFDGRLVEAPRTPQGATERILRIRQLLAPHLTDDINGYFRDPNDLSNCFCEFDKYERGWEQRAAGKRITLRKFTPSTEPLA